MCRPAAPCSAVPRLLCRGVPSELGLLRAAAPLLSAVQAYVEQGRYGRPATAEAISLTIGRGWPRMEATLSLI